MNDRTSSSAAPVVGESVNSVLIVANGKMYGPFPEQEIAQSWLNTHDIKTGRQLSEARHLAIGEDVQMYNIWGTELGTADTAHECGKLLQNLDEATRSSQTGRKTASA